MFKAADRVEEGAPAALPNTITGFQFADNDVADVYDDNMVLTEEQ